MAGAGEAEKAMATLGFANPAIYAQDAARPRSPDVLAATPVTARVRVDS